ncbi:MAG: TonB-dependent receptor [Sphingomicrobium sp.]
MKKLLLLCSAASIVAPTAAFAQSSGSQETEKDTIVVTGNRVNNGVDGVVVPDTTKAKAVITQELIARQAPGQTILNTLNLVPGVNFTQSDAYGSAGGNIRIRGFDGNRISLTFDGVPLNDSGNYAIFSNQQLDPELIEQVNVNLGVTDVDSPTASAAGGTINYRTIIPTNDMNVRVVTGLGQYDYQRGFLLLNTGRFTSFGTKAFIAASRAHNAKFKGPGDNNKWQVNGRIYQPLSNGDFISVAGNYNHNRNNFYRNPGLSDLRNLLGSTIVASTGSATSPAIVGGYDDTQSDLVNSLENLSSCNLTVPGPGTQNANGFTSGTPAVTFGSGPNGTLPVAPAVLGSINNNPANVQSCTNYYNLRINPSNTGNIRGQSRFTLTKGLILTVDPSFQYVLANGGGTTTFAENARQLQGSRFSATGGVDLNGDGDVRDTIRVFSPNNTNTRRIGLTSSLIWDLNPDHRVRVAYTYDRAHHRQTGEYGYLDNNGNPESVFGGRNGHPILDANGNVLQQRDRTSIASLNQLSGEYIGHFFDRRLMIDAGLRSPWFKRDLDNHCNAIVTSGFGYCSSEVLGTTPIPTSAGNFIVPVNYVPPPGGAPSNAVYAPFKAQYKYHKLLPNIGFTYKVIDNVSIFGNYAKGFSAPRTDNLYRAPVVNVTPESTDAFDGGVRYTTRQVQAQATVWKINYANRIVTSFDQALGISVDRNVGKVKSWGFDGSVAVKPIRQVALLGLVSYTKATLQQDILLGYATQSSTGATLATPVPIIAPTAGKMVPETPKWQYGGRAEVTLGPVDLGIQAKRVSSRFATDVNDVNVKGYTTVDLDARINLDYFGAKGVYAQLNVLNLLDEHYFGNLSTQINAFQICPSTTVRCANNTNNPNFTVGAPRTVLGSVSITF